jgi:hypothetical protein
MDNLGDLFERPEGFPVFMDSAMACAVIDHCQAESERLAVLIQANIFSHISTEVLVQNFMLCCRLELFCLRAMAQHDLVDLEENERAQNDVKSRMRRVFYRYED